jgi:hypothetical protein
MNESAITFRCSLALTLASLPQACAARGTVTRLAQRGRHYGFRLQLAESAPDLIGAWRAFDIEVRHPGAIRQALYDYVCSHAQPGAPDVELAYMGSGLLQVGRSCLFLSPAGPVRPSRPWRRTDSPAAPARA